MHGSGHDIINSSFLPSVLTHQFDKSASTKVRLAGSFFVSINFNEVLGVLVADGNHQPAAFNQLIDQCFRDLRSTGGDNDRIKRALLLPSIGAVGTPGDDVVVPKLVEKAACLQVKRAQAFNRVYAIHDLRQNGRL